MVKDREPSFPVHWSYSSWATHKLCALKYHQGYIMGIREPPNQWMARGTEVHRLAEFYLKGQITKLPPNFSRFYDMFKSLKKAKPIVEEFWGVDSSWKPVDKKSWCVMKMDAAVRPEYLDGWLYIVDFKTGREYDSHALQGELYSCIGLAKFPKVKGVISEFWYLDSKEKKPFTTVDYSAKYLRQRTNFWLKQGHGVLNRGQKFLPSPSEEGCKWCFHRSDKNGSCQEWKKVKELRRFK